MKENKRIVHMLIAVCILFLSLVVYLTYFELFWKNSIASNSYNRRQWDREERVIRGSISDRNGTVLAKSEKQKEGQQRIYPFGNLYSHIIGYNSRSYGRTLIEASYNNELLGLGELSYVFGGGLGKEGGYGNDLYLTIDHRLQAKAKELLKGKRGAVVAMEPKTGEILAMFSNPSFDPNSKSLSENWQDLVESEESPFLPRATQGLYTAGSTFKVVISASAIENGLEEQKFEDKGTITIDGKEFKNSGGRSNGTINLEKALAVSSNVVFSQLGVTLGERKLKDIAERFGVGKGVELGIPFSKGSFSYKDMSKADMAAVGIGQGKILVTPLYMAMITSCIANDGEMMKPYLVKREESHEGREIKEWKPEVLYNVISKDTSDKLKEMMRKAVASGTGKNASIKGISVAGKTGTAENELTQKEKNKEHNWFIAFAPVKEPQIAVAVILEYNGSTGGEAAAPIARELIRTWVNK
ncbi:peptidoglycan glycosyltransferase [Anaerobacterium chartisolvens]|uniref:Peptidoglycan glycosyltransferase n=1 Tax=Anaerobacterium chartisolvens TaxID=1297424 RepID=A0A369BDZ5_9FIRM|nr:penicillin-binding transpeptidase domain-containing protein [Anaerobacterium chartisolvens]RCX18828.1 peptidoglycan glycosyltransferase [Anaerobacterium chartisolvens]